MHKASLVLRHESSSPLAQHLPPKYPVLLPLSKLRSHASMFALPKNPDFISSFFELAKNDKRTVACSPPGCKR